MLDRVFGGDGVRLMASLFETRRPEPDEIEAMQEMLDALRAEGGNEAKGAKRRRGGER